MVDRPERAREASMANRLTPEQIAEGRRLVDGREYTWSWDAAFGMWCSRHVPALLEEVAAGRQERDRLADELTVAKRGQAEAERAAEAWMKRAMRSERALRRIRNETAEAFTRTEALIGLGLLPKGEDDG